MRTIKFRAWDEDYQTMYEDVGIGREGDYLIFEYDELEGEPDHWFNATTRSEGDYPFVLMQYTGLKDKNGKEIYEGDVLSTDLSRPYLVVEFRNGAFMYQCHDSGKDYYDIMLPIDEDTDRDKYSEVIGNIFEDGELLDDSKTSKVEGGR